MKQREIRMVMDARITTLVMEWYDLTERRFDHMADQTSARLLEDLRVAWDLAALSSDDYSTCLGIICYMGTNVEMEERIS